MTTLLLALAVLPAADTIGAVPCPAGQVIARDDMSGVLLMSDLIERLDGVSTASIDRFDLRPHLGAAPVGGASWVVFIDGVPVRMGAFGETDIHLLPVEVGEIDRVVLCPGAGIAAGRFASAGRLEITTNRERGRRARELAGAMRLANETGDPGPRRYLAGAAGNVDKIGPDFTGLLSAPVGSLSARWERRYPTDPATYARNREAAGHFPMVRYGAAGATLALPGASRLQAGGSYASDLWYLPSAGRELPVRRAAGQVAVTGGRSIGANSLGVRALMAGSSLVRRPDMPDSTNAGFDPGWSELIGSFDVELRRAGTGRTWGAGAHVEGRRAAGPGLLDGNAGLGRLWLQRSSHASPSLVHGSDVALVVGGDHVGVEAAITAQRRFERTSLSLTLGRDDHLPEEATGPAYWRGRGYAGLDSDAVSYVPAALFGRATEWSIRLDGTTALTDAVTAGASLGVRDYGDLTMEHGSFGPDSMAGVIGSVVALTGQGGRVASFLATASGHHGPASWSASYRFERTLDGTSAFEEAWRSVPAHLMRARLIVRPEPLLALRLGAEVRSSTSWAAYTAFDGVVNAAGHTFHSTVPSAVILDADAERLFLNRRLTVSLSLRNLLNVEERTHPLGASLALRLLVQASLRL